MGARRVGGAEKGRVGARGLIPSPLFLSFFLSFFSFLINLTFKSQLSEISLTFIAPEPDLVWVCFFMHRKADLLTLDYGEGKCSIYGGAKQG